MKAKSIFSTTIVISAILAQLTFAALPRYEIIDLGPGIAHGINEAGQVVGSYWSPTGEIAFMWDKSTGMMDLGTLGGPWSYAIGINNAGQVTGESRTAEGENHAFLWDKTGGMIDLGTLPGYAHSRPHGINNAGQVVGDSGDTAFLWEDGKMIELGTLGSSSYARAINNIGHVVGYSYLIHRGFHAFLWDSKNGMRDLGTLAHSSWSEACGINDCGQIVGISGDHVFLWEDGEMIDLGTLEQFSEFCTINDAGQVVGAAEYEEGKYYAFYWERSIGMITLDELLPTDSGWRTLCKAKDINNRCQIVGFGITEKGEEHAFLMKPVPPKIIYVDDDATGANDGSSWADAFNYLQDALAAAWSGDEIRVAQGVYKPDQGEGITPGDREATFQLINGVTLKGGYAGAGTPDPNARDIELYETILSGDLDRNDIDVNNPAVLLWEPTRAENSYHVVTGSGTDPNTILDGFTITAGNANVFEDVNDSGGGMYIAYGCPTLHNCTFSSNSAGNDGLGGGGGMYNKYSSPMLKNCTFKGNSADDDGAGGGMLNGNSNPTLTNCTFSRNSGGGGIMNWNGSSKLVNCTFSENTGGGIHNYESNMVLTNCTFSRNLSLGGGGGTGGWGGRSTLTNCTFSENLAYQHGGGLWNTGGDVTLTNCTFSGNLALKTGGGIYNKDSSPTLMNCTITMNTAAVGGGVSYRGQRHFLDDSVITDNIITENTAVDGGGIYCSGSPTITNNIITKNIAVNGGGIYCYEGGMIANNTIKKNTAQCGGGIFTWEDYAPIIINNIISENWAQEEGGGIGTHDNSPTIIGNLIIGNATAGNGGGIYLQSALSEEITNNTIAGNKAASGGGICTYIVSMKVTNCILWGNIADIGSQIAMKTIDPSHRFSILTVNYSDILGGAAEIYVGGGGFLNWGEGNIDADPLFVQPGFWNAKDTWIEGDYHLLFGSPCIDAGDPNYIAGPNETDLDGRPRIIGGRIDMGAYETPILAEARILPRTINIASKGKWITAFIWLPEAYDVADIESDSILLEGQINTEQFSVDEQKQVATAIFDREKVQGILSVGDIKLTITCQLTDGTYFEATDIIQVTDKSSSK